mgnify:FL=1
MATCFIGEIGADETIDPMCLWLGNESKLQIEERNSRLKLMTTFIMQWSNYPLCKDGIEMNKVIGLELPHSCHLKSTWIPYLMSCNF